MGIENFFRRKPAIEKSEAQAEHDKKTTREASMIGAAALAAAAGAGATYENVPDLQATMNNVDRVVEASAPTENNLPGGVKIEKSMDGTTVIHVPVEKASNPPEQVHIELNEQPVHINLDEHREQIDSIEQ
jgi:hypothetical protein